jgi:2-polyprenyl-3-methyl-5-hydroxy-6-metoxy-1,4-benzoquinol methylase
MQSIPNSIVGHALSGISVKHKNTEDRSRRPIDSGLIQNRELIMFSQLIRALGQKIELLILRLFQSSAAFLFHPQFIARRNVDSNVKSASRAFMAGSKILDVGCGSGPYWPLRPDCQWVGLDVYQSKPGVIVVPEGSTWEIESGSFDGVLCTQVLEHAFDFQLTLSEITRILKPGGILIVSVPFAFPYHGAPYDFHRFTAFAMEEHLRDFQILDKTQVGNYFESAAISKNLYIEAKLSFGRINRFIRIVCLPLLVTVYSFNNLKALMLGRLDKNSISPTGMILVCKK